jgi:predicted ATPase/DNA-binding CsgD family transcriptional regulator
MDRRFDKSGEEQSMAEHEPRDSGVTPLPSLRAVPAFERDFLALPRPLTTFIGRASETAEIVALVRDGARLVTLTGPGGVGKTRLALHVAGPLADDFPDGVAFVSLASVSEPEQVLPAIAHALGVRGEGQGDLLASLASQLRNQRALLILDNLEHVAEAAPAITSLLSACPWLHVLTTSRVRLRLSGENVLGVPPLKLRNPQADRSATRANDAIVAPDVLVSEAVQLFVDRARSANRAFALNADNADVVAEICRRLDGLPLAIELAAARVIALPPVGLLVRLEQRLPLLTGGPRDAPTRQQTVRNTIAWSHGLLNPEEQVLFRRLGVFVGDWTLEAAEVVANPDGDLDVLGHLASLVEANLVLLIEGAATPRYGMLETIREFAAERLAGSPEEHRVREAYARYMLNLASKAWWAFPERHYVKDAQEWLEHTLSLAETTSDEARSHALARAALAAFNAGDFATAEELAEASLKLGKAGGFDLQIGVALYALLLVYQERGDFARSLELGEESIRYFRRSGDEHWLSDGLLNTWVTALLDGNVERAAELQEEGFALCRKVGNTVGLALAMNDVGSEAELRGDLRTALTGYRESLELNLTINEHVYIAHPLAGIASILSVTDQGELAARLLGVAAQIHETHGTFAWIAERERDRRTAPRLRELLGEAQYATAFAAGRNLPIATAARLALAATAVDSARVPIDGESGIERFDVVSTDASEDPARAQSAPGSAPAIAHPNALTRREQEILDLLGQRLSDAEIAEQLYIGVRTVEFHVSNILGKCGVANRRDAAALAISLNRD